MTRARRPGPGQASGHRPDDGRRRAATSSPRVVGLLVALALLLGAGQGLRPAQDPGSSVAAAREHAGAVAAAQPAPDLAYAHAATWPLPAAALEPEAGVGRMRPIDLALLEGGGLAVADGRANRVHVFDADGRPRGTPWGPPAALEDADLLAVPLALVAGEDGRSVVVLWQRYEPERDEDGDWLRYRPRDAHAVRHATEGAPLGPPVRLAAQAGDLARHPVDGSIWATDGELCRMLRLAPSDLALTETFVPRHESQQSHPCQALRLALTATGRLIMVTKDRTRAVIFGADGAEEGRLSIPDDAPVHDVVTDAAGQVHLLLGPPTGAPAGSAPIVQRYGPDLAPAVTLRAADLARDDLPGARWPWALDLRGAWLASSGAGERFRVHRSPLEPAGAGWALTGDERMERFGPFDPIGRFTDGQRLALATVDGMDVAVLDDPAPWIAAFRPDGQSYLLAGRVSSEGDGDLAVDEDGGVYLTAGDEVMRLERADRPGAPPDAPPRAVWRAPCDCGAIGGRLAVAGGALLLARRGAGTVEALDPETGARLGRQTMPDQAGLWPWDVAALPDAWLSADAVKARLERWPLQAPGPDARWQVGLFEGPVRVATVLLPGGAPRVGLLLSDASVQLHDGTDGALLARFQPTLPDGRPLAADDLALTADGRVVLADETERALQVFAPSTAPTATPAAAPTATPPRTEASCRMIGDKRAAPARVLLGETVAVTLTLRADCPQGTRTAGADVLLALDRSSSMEGQAFRAAREAARLFTAQLSGAAHRVGIVAFDDDAELVAPLSFDLDEVRRVLDGLDSARGDGPTDLRAALLGSEQHLVETAHPLRQPVLVLLSDGRYEGADDPRDLAADLRQSQVQIYTVGLGASVDLPLLRDLAADPARFFHAPRPEDLLPIYQQVRRQLVGGLAGQLTLEDRMGPDVALLAGSADPPAAEGRDHLRWGWTVLPAEGLTLTYRVRPLRPGLIPTNAEAFADYTDADGPRRRFAFPVPIVEVLAPTATPTASPSPTATLPPTATPPPSPSPTATLPPTATPPPSATVPPTPRPSATPTLTPSATPRPTRTPALRVWLPFAARQPRCIPSHRPADLLLLMDTSSSMEADGKLAAARAAARTFLRQVAAGPDQVGVVSFDAEARLDQALSPELGRADAALVGLRTARGTRIDLGLQRAIAELAGPRARPEARPVLVLLTDGRPQGGSEAATRREARTARAFGIALYAIGLGGDVDADLLAEMAGPERTYLAPEPGDLAALYAEIADAVPCD